MKYKLHIIISIVVLATKSLLAQPLPPAPFGNPVPIGELSILIGVGASIVFASYKLSKKK